MTKFERAIAIRKVLTEDFKGKDAALMQLGQDASLGCHTNSIYGNELSLLWDCVGNQMYETDLASLGQAVAGLSEKDTKKVFISAFLKIEKLFEQDEMMFDMLYEFVGNDVLVKVAHNMKTTPENVYEMMIDIADDYEKEILNKSQQWCKDNGLYCKEAKQTK
jgi:hypothetical protein